MQKPSNKKYIGATILFALLLSLGAAETPKPAADPSLPPRRFPSSLGLKISPSWKVENEEGQRQALSSVLPADKVVMIFFLSATDPATRACAERISQMGEQYKKKPLFLLALSVNRGESLHDLKALGDRYDWDLPIYRDVDQNIAKGLKVGQTTQVLILSRGVVRYSGALDDCWFDQRLVNDRSAARAADALMAGSPVLNPEPGYYSGEAIK